MSQSATVHHSKYGCDRCTMRYIGIRAHADGRRCICGGRLVWLGYCKS